MYNFMTKVDYIDNVTGDILVYRGTSLCNNNSVNDTILYFFQRKKDKRDMKYADHFLVYKPINIIPKSKFGKVLYG